MRKLLPAVLLLSLFVVLLSGCGFAQNDYDDDYVYDYDSGYEDGYEDGYDEGYMEGVFECKKDFGDAVRCLYSDVEHATLNGRDLHPEDAIMVLNDYLDGKYVSDEELESAINVLTDFYFDWQSVLANIEDLDIDIYFD